MKLLSASDDTLGGSSVLGAQEPPGTWDPGQGTCAQEGPGRYAPASERL